jgi:hypothetical protein
VTETFSRELAYSDEAAAVSPQLVGSTTAALGGAPAGPQSLSGFISSVGSAIADVVQGIGEQLVLGTIRDDSVRAGISLQNVQLLPMRLHDNHAEFEAVDLAAWTNSSQHVYVNIPWFVDQYSSAVAAGSTPEDALRQARAIAVYVMRHEEHHVNQFAGNGDQPPASFADMIGFEEQAYGQDVTWLQSQPVQTFMLSSSNGIGTSQAVVTALEQSATANHAKFSGWKTSLQTEASRKSALIGADFLPKSIRGSTNYAPADLYKTRTP